MKQLQLTAKQKILAEILAGLALVSWVIFILGSFRRGETTQVHDNIYWEYPIFKFFAAGILKGEIPFWNPYTHGGEPFYPILVQDRLLEPIKWLTIVLFGRFMDDATMIYNFTRIVEILLSNLGIYLCVRLFTKHLVTRLCVISVLTLSSLFIASFRQSGMLFQFQWSGYLLFFYLRTLRRGQFSTTDAFGMALALGLSWQSYWFAGIWNLFVVFSLACLLFSTRKILGVAKLSVFDKRVWLATALMLLMVAPNFVLWRESDQYQFPSRSVLRDDPNGEVAPSPAGSEGSLTETKQGMKMSWEVVRNTGTPALVWDLLRIINVEGNKVVANGETKFFGEPSDAFIYLSLLVIFFALVGMLHGKDPLQRPLFATFLVFLFLMLGQFGGLQRLLYPILPTLWFSRHMSFLVAFVAFFFLIFFAIGMERWLEAPRVIVVEKSTLAKLLLTTLIFVASGSAQVFLLLPQYFSYESAWFSLVLFLGTALIFRVLQPRSNVCYWIFFSLLGVVLAGHFDWYWLVMNRVLPLFVLPIGAALLVTTLGKGKGFPLIPVMMAVIVFVDLNLFLASSSKLYAEMPKLEAKLQLETKLNPELKFPAARYVAEPSVIWLPFMEQFIRYYSLFDQNSYVFSGMAVGTLNRGVKDSRYRARIDTFYLTRDYAKLIQSSLTDEQLEAVFAVGAPTVQFKTSARSLSDSRPLPDDYFKNGLQLEQTMNPVTGSQDPSFVASLLSFSANHAEMRVENGLKGWLYWADGFHPFWSVRVDGKQEAILKANQGFKAVRLEPGQHSVIFTFSPKPFVIALWIYMISFGLLCCGLLSAWIAELFKGRETVSSQCSPSTAPCPLGIVTR